MGGAPTISGGMTQAEYQELLAEQRKYAEQAEKERMTKIEQMEKERVSAEKELLEAQKLAEAEKIAAQQAAEAELAEEIKAVSEEEETDQTRLSSSFYDSLYRGLSSDQPRPE